jgi:hypothetical protein
MAESSTAIIPFFGICFHPLPHAFPSYSLNKITFFKAFPISLSPGLDVYSFFPPQITAACLSLLSSSVILANSSLSSIGENTSRSHSSLGISDFIYFVGKKLLQSFSFNPHFLMQNSR